MIEERRNYDDLKSYIRDTLGQEIARLTRVIDSQGQLLRDIELKTTTRTAEMQKDIDNLYGDVDSLKKAIADVRRALEQEESTRQFISNENRNLISNTKEQNAARWEAQTKLNESMKQQIDTINKLMWAAIMLLMGLMGTTAYQIIFGG